MSSAVGSLLRGGAAGGDDPLDLLGGGVDALGEQDGRRVEQDLIHPGAVVLPQGLGDLAGGSGEDDAGVEEGARGAVRVVRVDGDARPAQHVGVVPGPGLPHGSPARSSRRPTRCHLYSAQASRESPLPPSQPLIAIAERGRRAAGHYVCRSP
ncbi:hypothetical protein ACIRYZ_23910 [Kitasatospora sp. NPDC101155]|uniref:hypothetical protein n=1 Tax=Kitasatospora sp. NPDC101155 TaxID=3364097 RepID=UPI0038057CD9